MEVSGRHHAPTGLPPGGEHVEWDAEHDEEHVEKLVKLRASVMLSVMLGQYGSK
jgi:hypothetical protein